MHTCTFQYTLHYNDNLMYCSVHSTKFRVPKNIFTQLKINMEYLILRLQFSCHLHIICSLYKTSFSPLIHPLNFHTSYLLYALILLSNKNGNVIKFGYLSIISNTNSFREFARTQHVISATQTPLSLFFKMRNFFIYLFFDIHIHILYTATKIPIMCSQKRTSAV